LRPSERSLHALADDPAARRFIRELLKYTRQESRAPLDLISTYSSCSREFSARLIKELGIPLRDGVALMSRESRLDLAMSEANRGFLHDASRFLEWQDFERLAERCLVELGFETFKNARVKDENRSWQLDVVGIKERLVICLDCKHWAPPMTLSRFKDPEVHQSRATELFASKIANERHMTITSLPVILTLFEPPQRILGSAVLVSVQMLPSMLRELTPYTPGLPFATATCGTAENPMSESPLNLGQL
jgi:hypothetical protein